MIIEAGWPLVENQEWFAANPGGPIRKIVSEPCGVGLTAVGKYIKDRREGWGFFGRLGIGAGKKGPREAAMKSKMPDGETLYYSIVCRISAVRRECRLEMARNLPRYIAVDEDGPKLPGVSVRVPLA